MSDETPQDLVTPALSAGLRMATGTRYVVVKPSNDGTFQAGDHITMNAGGSILCREAQGWIDACDVAEASVGMAVEVDKEWVEKRKEKLRKELSELEGEVKPKTHAGRDG